MSDIRELRSELRALKNQVQNIEQRKFCNRVEWKITNVKEKLLKFNKGESFSSPNFTLAGIPDVKLEFFPRGRETATLEGCCSLFLWCPVGTKVQYQLAVGSHYRTPDEDSFNSTMGHGHTNFCLLEDQRDPETDTVTCSVTILEGCTEDRKEGDLLFYSQSVPQMVSRELEIWQNRNVEHVEWKIPNIRSKMESLQPGSALCSPIFTAAGIRMMVFEFYVNGVGKQYKEGYCGFYLRCPTGTKIVLTLRVGNAKKGPIQASFDSASGKGLPEYCKLADQIDEDGSVTVGVDIQNSGEILTDTKRFLQIGDGK